MKSLQNTLNKGDKPPPIHAEQANPRIQGATNIKYYVKASIKFCLNRMETPFYTFLGRKELTRLSCLIALNEIQMKTFAEIVMHINGLQITYDIRKILAGPSVNSCFFS